MRHFPVFLNLTGRDALVLGTGEAAERKVALLGASGACIRRAVRFTPDLLEDCAIAFAAGAAAADQLALHAAATNRGIPVNVVDQPELCSFFSPAVIDRDPITIAIGSGGAAPVLARRIRASIEAILPDTIGRLAMLLERWKPELRRRHPDAPARRMVIERALDGPAAALALAGQDEAADAAFARAIAGAPVGGMAFIIGAGPGSADLLTLRAQRLLGEADTILHDPTVSEPVLTLARRDATRFSWLHPHDPIAELTRLAGSGQRVVWLLPGNPGADPACEAWLGAIRACGIAAELVPGVALQ